MGEGVDALAEAEPEGGREDGDVGDSVDGVGAGVGAGGDAGFGMKARGDVDPETMLDGEGEVAGFIVLRVRGDFSHRVNGQGRVGGRVVFTVDAAPYEHGAELAEVPQAVLNRIGAIEHFAARE